MINFIANNKKEAPFISVLGTFAGGVKFLQLQVQVLLGLKGGSQEGSLRVDPTFLLWDGEELVLRLRQDQKDLAKERSAGGSLMPAGRNQASRLSAFYR